MRKVGGASSGRPPPCSPPDPMAPAAGDRVGVGVGDGDAGVGATVRNGVGLLVGPAVRVGSVAGAAVGFGFGVTAGVGVTEAGFGVTAGFGVGRGVGCGAGRGVGVGVGCGVGVRTGVGVGLPGLSVGLTARTDCGATTRSVQPTARTEPMIARLTTNVRVRAAIEVVDVVQDPMSGWVAPANVVVTGRSQPHHIHHRSRSTRPGRTVRPQYRWAMGGAARHPPS